MPIGPSEWNKVVETHAVDYPGRTDTSIRRKYNSLHRVTVPTGDPNCPDEVKQAKRIKYSIGQKAAIGGGEEDFDLESGTFIGLGVLGEPPVDLATPLPSSTRASTENVQENAFISHGSTSPTDLPTTSTASVAASASRSPEKRNPSVRFGRRAQNGELAELIKMQIMHNIQNCRDEKAYRLEREREKEKERKGERK